MERYYARVNFSFKAEDEGAAEDFVLRMLRENGLIILENAEIETIELEED